MSFHDLNSTARPISRLDGETLLDVALSSIRTAHRTGESLVVEAAAFSDTLRHPRASFVTLRIRDELRGCMGSVEARAPLVVDVAENAFHAAFVDPRFPPLGPAESPRLTVQVSVLSPMQPINFESERHALEQVRLGTDGLRIKYGPYHGLLLPSVWEQLPDKKQFLRALKEKVGLPPEFWTDQITISRFTTESFVRHASPLPADHAA